MHIPDGFFDAGTSLGAGAAAAGGLGVAVRKTASFLEDKHVPMAGLVAAFIFAAQMLNFPVAAGTSGHLIGAALAAILVGPWAGALCLAVVLLVQALFADGGLTALGLNIVNMSFAAGLGCYVAFLVARRLAPSTSSGVVVASGVAAFVSVIVAAAAFVMEYALGGAGGASIVTVARAMIGVHSLIGIGEAAITMATVGMVLSVRPDLVYGAQHLAPTLRPAPARPVEEAA